MQQTQLIDENSSEQTELDSNKIKGFDIQSFLAYRLNILAKRMTLSVADIYMSEFNISIPEWRVMLWVNSNNNVYAKDISFHCLMDKTQVSRVIVALEKRELLTRKVDDEDHRSQRLSLTENGKELIKDIIPKAEEWQENLINVLSSRQNDNLFKIIDRLEYQLINNLDN